LEALLHKIWRPASNEERGHPHDDCRRFIATTCSRCPHAEDALVFWIDVLHQRMIGQGN
jgi:hypothetical protein